MDDTMNPGLRGIGDNSGSVDEAARIRDNLDEKHRALLNRADQLLEAEDRVPPEIGDDDQAGKVGDLVRLITAATQAAESARKTEKEPHMAAGRAVDGFFREITEPLDALKTRIGRRLTAYLTAKAERERRAREEEARKLREDAERQAAAAAQVEAAAPEAAAIVMEQAIASEAQAHAAERAAMAKPAELSRTRGDVGSVASLSTRWVGTIEDRATLDLEVLRPYLPLAALQTALNGAVKAGLRTIKGTRIVEESVARVR